MDLRKPRSRATLVSGGEECQLDRENSVHRGEVRSSPNFVERRQHEVRRITLPKLSEKPRTRLLRSLTDHLNHAFRLTPVSVYKPNTGSERCSYPFSDSLSTHSGE